MSFEPLVAPHLSGKVNTIVTLDPAGDVPSNIIDIDDKWFVHITWEVSGHLVNLGLGTQWEVKVFVESMGDFFEGQIGDTLLLDYSATLSRVGNTWTWHVDIPIDAGQPPDVAAYKLVVTLLNKDSEGKPTNLAGFQEMDGLIQIVPV